MVTGVKPFKGKGLICLNCGYFKDISKIVISSTKPPSKTCIWSLEDKVWYVLHDGDRKLYSVREANFGQHWAMMRRWADEHGYHIVNLPSKGS